MSEKEIIAEAMKTCNWNQDTLSKALGYKNQSSVSERLRGKSMRVDTFVKFLNAMGYKLVVVSQSPQTNKNKWTVDYAPSVVSEKQNEINSLLEEDD